MKYRYVWLAFILSALLLSPGCSIVRSVFQGMQGRFVTPEATGHVTKAPVTAAPTSPPSTLRATSSPFPEVEIKKLTGSFNGNVYTNDFFQFTISFPKDWTVASKEFIAEAQNLGEEWINAYNEELSNELNKGDTKVIPCFMVGYDRFKGNINMNCSRIDGLGIALEDPVYCLRLVKMTLMNEDMPFTFGDVTPITIGGRKFAKMAGAFDMAGIKGIELLLHDRARPHGHVHVDSRRRGGHAKVGRGDGIDGVPLIFDIHCHLGNILYPGGGKTIFTDAPMARPFDPDALRRLLLYHGNPLDGTLFSLPNINRLMTRAERLRNFTASLKNLSRQLDRHNVARAAVMPIAPNTTFEDLLPANQADRRLVPFGSVDFTIPDLPGQVRRQLAQGAKGFKLHPILQRVTPDGPEAHEALSAMPPGTIVLLHAGEAVYYLRKEGHLQRPEYGGIGGIRRLCRAFPALRFVAAHGGLRQFRELLEQLSPLPNVWVDTSFVSPAGIRALIEAFGAGRVLFASDWPYGFYGTGLAAVRAACRRNADKLDGILGGNAEDLLGLRPQA